MIITLVGYRGTGKSSVAGLLAKRLKMTAIDADALLEERAGRSIREIFAAEGEAAFRAMERELLAELLRGSGLVLAAGGGAILDPQTRRDMRAAGPVVWLTASADTIARRLDADATTRDRRPALTDSDPQTEIKTLLALREPFYREVATCIVDTDQREVPEIVEDILAQLGSVVRHS